jgi:hypothetical protein
MRYALFSGEKTEAFPGARGTCPGCGGETIAKCGALKIWHWAHVGDDCDPWHEPESAWHLGWKNEAPSAQCEVVIGQHRADIVGKDGTVVELQHSAIPPADIAARERFYGRMIWLFDAAPFAENVSLRIRGSYTTFRWRWPRKTHGEITRPLFWDFGAFASAELEKEKQSLSSTIADIESIRTNGYYVAWCDDGHGGRKQAKFKDVAGLESVVLRDCYERALRGRDLWAQVAENPIFQIRKIDVKPPCGGWGVWHSRAAFVERYIGSEAAVVDEGQRP